MYLWGEVMAGKNQELGFRDVGNSLFVGSVYVHSLCKNPSSCLPMIDRCSCCTSAGIGCHSWLSWLAVTVGCHCLLCPLHSRTNAVLLVEGMETKTQSHDTSWPCCSGTMGHFTYIMTSASHRTPWCPWGNKSSCPTGLGRKYFDKYYHFPPVIFFWAE